MGSRHRQAPGHRSRQQYFVTGHLHVVAPLREPAPEGLDVARIVAGAEVVALPGEFVHPRGEVVGIEMTVVGGFQPMLRGGAGFAETECGWAGLPCNGLVAGKCCDGEGQRDFRVEHIGIRGKVL